MKAEKTARRASAQLLLSSALGFGACIAIAVVGSLLGLVFHQGRVEISPIAQAALIRLAVAGGLIALFKNLELVFARSSLDTERAESNWIERAEKLRVWVRHRDQRRIISPCVASGTLTTLAMPFVYFRAGFSSLGPVPPVLGRVAFMAQGVIEFNQSFESWVVNEWRRDAIVKEQRSYVHGAEPYGRGRSDFSRLFVNRVEQLIAAQPEDSRKRKTETLELQSQEGRLSSDTKGEFSCPEPQGDLMQSFATNSTYSRRGCPSPTRSGSATMG